MTSNLRVQELDFDTIKSNLKDFLRDKPEFTDYDFEGSGINALINLLAYNTHYTAVLANMQMGEMFLDTATKRTTTALHASRLGYIPGSVKSPVAIVNLEIFPEDAPDTITIGKGAIFNSSVLGNNFQFVTTESRTVARSSLGRYLFDNLEIREGTYKQFRYLYSDVSDRFQIPTKSVDINTITVKVQISESNTSTDTYQHSKSIIDLTKNSQAYFIRLNSNGYYEVYFGDGILSKALTVGNIIHIEYIESNGDLANGAQLFTFNDSVQGYTSNLLTVVAPATGGALEETADQIRVNAQASVSTQNRAVTLSDYKTVIKEIYPVDSVTVWGGEQNNPPVYGKVFISLKPTGSTEFINTATKEYIKSEIIKKKNVITISPEIVDPDYVYISVKSTVYFDDTISNYSASTIETFVKESVSSYAAANLGKFENILRYSRLCKDIDSADQSILSNITKITMRKEFPFSYINSGGYLVDFGNPIIPSTSIQQNIFSTAFYVDSNTNPVYIDDLNGILRLYYYDGAVKKIYNSNIGSIDYATGRMGFSNVATNASADGLIKISATPQSNDIFSMRENIIVLYPNDISVDAIVEQKDVTRHIFTASR